VLLTMTVFLLDELVCGEACILVVLFRLDRYRRIWEDYNLMEVFSQAFLCLGAYENGGVLTSVGADKSALGAINRPLHLSGMRTAEHWGRADKSALGAINRPLRFVRSAFAIIYNNLFSTISIVGMPLTPSCSMEKEATQLAKFTAARALLCWYKWDRKAAAKTSPAPVGSISRAG
jgi:hypothetical protein